MPRAGTTVETAGSTAIPDTPEFASFLLFCLVQFRLLDGTSESRYFCPFGTPEGTKTCALLDKNKARDHFLSDPKEKDSEGAKVAGGDRDIFTEWLTSGSERSPSHH